MPEWKHEIRQRLASLKLAPGREAEIVEELAQHLGDLYAELRAGGATEEEAARATLAELSERELLQQELWRVESKVEQEPIALGSNRRSNMIADFWQDLRYATRMLGKQPGFTAVVALTLALGIGVNVAIFSNINRQLRPLPVNDPDSIVKLDYQPVEKGISEFSFSDYVFFREQTQVFSSLIASSEEGFLLGSQTAGTEPEEVLGAFVSDNFFSALGVNAVRGRAFTAEENSAPGRDPVVVLSQHLWQRRFAGDPNIVGQTLLLNEKHFVVIGVMGRDFEGISGESTRLWLPLVMRSEMLSLYYPTPAARKDWLGRRSLPWLSVYGRIKPGRTLAEGQAEMTVLLSQLARAWPEINPKDSIHVTPAQRSRGGFWRAVAMTMGATGIVLLIACSNIANMLLARVAGRQKEIGVRLCLGASRRRVIRQLLTESLLLAFLGAVIGLLMSGLSLYTIARFVAP